MVHLLMGKLKTPTTFEEVNENTVEGKKKVGIIDS
jgi:hypothetical protein